MSKRKVGQNRNMILERLWSFYLENYPGSITLFLLLQLSDIVTNNHVILTGLRPNGVTPTTINAFVPGIALPEDRFLCPASLVH